LMLRRSRAGWHASLQAEFSFPCASCAPALLQVPCPGSPTCSCHLCLQAGCDELTVGAFDALGRVRCWHHVGQASSSRPLPRGRVLSPLAPCTPTCLLGILKGILMSPACLDILVGAVQVPGTASHASDDEDGDQSSDATSSVSRCAWLPVTASRLRAACLATAGLC
jgi:hypothetical protein